MHTIGGEREREKDGVKDELQQMHQNLSLSHQEQDRAEPDPSSLLPATSVLRLACDSFPTSVGERVTEAAASRPHACSDASASLRPTHTHMPVAAVRCCTFAAALDAACLLASDSDGLRAYVYMCVVRFCFQ